MNTPIIASTLLLAVLAAPLHANEPEEAAPLYEGIVLPAESGHGDPEEPALVLVAAPVQEEREQEDDSIDSTGELLDEIVLDEGESFLLVNFASIVGDVNSAFPVSTSDDEGALIVRDLKVGRAFGDLRVEGGLIAIDFYHRPDVEDTVGGLYGGTGLIGGVFKDFRLSEDSNKSIYVGSNTIGIKTGEDWETTTQVEGGLVVALNDSVYARLGNFLNTNVDRINWTWVGQSEISALVGRPSILGGPTQFRVGFEAIWVREITAGNSYPRYIFKFNLNRQGRFGLPW